MQPCLATESDIRAIDELLCSAQKPIGLIDEFVRADHLEARIKWFGQLRDSKLLWIIRDANSIAGLLILDQKPDGVMEIRYVVVAERLRGKREIGPALIQHAQTIFQTLIAEARNAHSSRLFQKCGFRETGFRQLIPDDHFSEKFPLFTWSDSKRA